jgi:NTE family protein
MNQRLSLQQWLKQKPFCLSMGAGFFGFYAHCGFISALESADLKPVFISGASSGALIGSMWASGMPVDEIQHQILRISKSDFWDPGLGLGLLKGRLFKKLLRDLFPVSRVEHCPIGLSVSAFSPITWQSKAIQFGVLSKAVYASCAVPGLFQPQWINGVPHWDGGIRDREALAVYNRREQVIACGSADALQHINNNNSHHLRVLHHRIPTRSTSIQPKKAPCINDIKTIQLQNIPRSGPDLMHLGAHIMQLSKAQMQALLKSPVTKLI